MSNSAWPELDFASWRDTSATLQLWAQMVGKIRLALTPWLNHGWQVPLYVTARGLGTSAIPVGDAMLDLEFDFVESRLVCRTSSGGIGEIALRPISVAVFYRELMAALAALGVEVAIRPVPSEIAEPIPFPDDRVHASYDPDAARRFWLALTQAHRVLTLFRTGFLGKASPVHFFWGGFDLAVSRFTGRTAPPHPGGIPGLPDHITREAYSHEESSAGFWPGSEAYPHAVFYSYAYPEPAGFRDQPMPPGAAFDETLGEFVLRYDAVRASPDPDALLLEFLSASYAAAADCGGWDRAALECPLGLPRIPRVV